MAAALTIVSSPAYAFPESVNNNAINANAASNVTLEYLNRGISAINTGNGMLISWRYLANDDDNAIYKLYRDGLLIYTSESGQSTCYLDAEGSASSKYRVDTLSGGKVISSENCNLISDNAYFDIPMTPPTGSDCTYSPNDMSVGDIDGDGQYELFVKWDPSNSKDNSQKGKTGNVFIDCIRLDGTRVWRIDLGVNIRAGAHYTQFYVADFDLDGKAEMTCKTADGTIDGTGKVIGDASKDYRNSSGYIISGPEYYTLFDGATGEALDTVDYEPGRGDVSKWGDKYGNRVDRFWGSVAYVDGVHPSVITGRGYYTRLTATCYSIENKKLVKKWTFDTGNSKSVAGYGDGNHNSMPADVDGDGKQEIITGAACIDDNGKLLWATGQGHGDALHLADLDPEREGLELWICHEDEKSGYGVSYIDPKTGKILFHNNGAGDTGRCCADNIWAGNAGAELWGNKESDGSTPVKNVKGETLNCKRPAINFLSYWDGDLEREILDGYTDSPATISKMNEDGKLTQLLSTDGYYTCNTTKGTPCLSADIFGDWREELIVRAADSKSVRIYCTSYDTDYRITTLMHDAQYRMQVSSQNTAYNQPPHPSFFLGTGYELPARPTDSVNTANVVVNPSKEGAVIDTVHTYKIKNKNSGLYLEVADSKAENGANVQQGTTGATGWRFEESETSGYYYIYSELGDGKTYLLDIDFGKIDNGTNIGIWGNTNSDAQLFKMVDNGDGTYAICTKVTDDNSGIGVTSASKESGANVIEWECNDSDDQKWTLEIKIDPINGKLIKDLTVKDMNNYQNWKIADSAEVGSPVFGDRDVTYTELPDTLKGAEVIQTACDSKNSKENLAEFTSDKNIKVYVALDTRVESSMGAIPEWLNGWTKTGEQAKNSGDVTFDIYEKSYKAGETVTLGTNSTNYTVVNYTVFVKEDVKEVVTTTTTTAPPTTQTTTTTESSETTLGVTLLGDANCDGRLTIADATAIVQHMGNQDEYGLSPQGLINADCCNPGDGVSGKDANAIQMIEAGLITSLPVID
ncbi:MAG: RICIN domain-containing protein [Ruminococcus sp.]|nr:RICIN domain-containing protein [Ruminococcus sp.]